MAKFTDTPSYKKRTAYLNASQKGGRAEIDQAEAVVDRLPEVWRCSPTAVPWSERTNALASSRALGEGSADRKIEGALGEGKARPAKATLGRRDRSLRLPDLRR